MATECSIGGGEGIKGCNGSECLAALAMEELCICLSLTSTSPSPRLTGDAEESYEYLYLYLYL